MAGVERATNLGDARHDPSIRWVDNPTPDPDDVVTLEAEGPAGTTLRLRTVVDGEATWIDGAEGADGRWTFELPCRQAVVNYRFLIEGDGPARWLTGAGELDWDPPDMWDYRLLVGNRPPDWVPATVWYQIFPDRFATSGRHLPDGDPSGEHAWVDHSPWDAPVRRGREAMTQLYGGDLDGIAARLDHIADLGVGGIYLTPIFPARSNHRYDATSFERIDPLLGGEAALVRLREETARRSLRLISDLTLNHTGDHHEWFLAARTDAAATEASWFHFTDHPDRYESWLGVPTLPKLDHRSESLRRRFYDGPESVLGRFLAEPYDLDGWRIDVANMTGRLGMLDMNHEVARLARRTVDGFGDGDGGPWLVGEHFHDAIPDAAGDGWHGIMNYGGVSRPIASWLGKADLLATMTAGPGIMGRTGVQVARSMDAVRAGLAWQVSLGSMSLLGSHDTARWRTIARTDELAMVGFGLLLMLPGAPTFFYGDEVGLTGEDNEAARAPMPWTDSSWDRRFLDWYRSVIALRNRFEALSVGGFQWVDVRDDALTFLRETRDERLLVRAARAETGPVSLPCAALGARRGEPVLNAEPLTTTGADLILPGDGPALSVWHLEP